MRHCRIVLTLALTLPVLGAAAGPDRPLTAGQAETLRRIAPALREAAGCSRLLDNSTHDGSKGRLASRLSRFARWLVAVGKDSAKVVTAVQERAATMRDTVTHPLTPSPYPVAGDRAAPVLVTVFVSGSCNLCKYVTWQLYQAVTEGELVGTARVEVKPFGTMEADRALGAAAVAGVFWPYLGLLAGDQLRHSRHDLLKFAERAGADRRAFERYMDSDSLFALIGRSTQEGRREGVTVSPTVFIDHRRYRSYKDPVWVADAAAYAAEVKRVADHEGGLR
jgi:protein-disulfide isomerase